MKKGVIIGIIIILLFGLIVYLVFGRSNSTIDEETENTPTPTTILPTISSDITVELLASSNKRAVSLKISDFPADIETVEYELIYITGTGLPRGVNGKITLKGEKQVARDNITLGSCSTGGKCTYDEGVRSIDVTLKFNSPKGSSIYQKTFPL